MRIMTNGRRRGGLVLSLVALLAVLVLALPAGAQDAERFDEKVRELFFAGFAGNEDALQRAVARNTLLHLEVESGPPQLGLGGEDSGEKPRSEDWYFLNTAKGRQSVAAIRQGRLAELQAVVPAEARLQVQRPNVFVLYEQNFGLMTAMIADQLRDLEKSYPPNWIVEAMEIALVNNKRHLNYIRAVLRRWEAEGKDNQHG